MEYKTLPWEIKVWCANHECEESKTQESFTAMPAIMILVKERLRMERLRMDRWTPVNDREDRWLCPNCRG